MASSTNLDSFVADFHSHFTSDPNERIMKGIDRDLGELPDPSLAANERRVSSARALLTSLDGVESVGSGAAEDFDTRLDLELARLMLESEIHVRTLTFNDRLQVTQMPRGGDEIGDGLFLLMANDPRDATRRLADITARLEKIPAYLDALLSRLETPVARWIDIEKEKIEAMPGLFDATVGFARSESWEGAPALIAAAESAAAALPPYLARLDELETTTSLHIGEQAARELVRLRGIDLSLEELHAVARDFLAETRETLAELRSELAPKHGLPADIPLADLHTALNEKFAVAAGDGSDMEPVLDRYRAERSRVMSFIDERQLFPILPDQEMKILATPTFLEPSIPAGAMMPPPPFRDGTRTSLIYLTIKPDQLDDHTELGIPGMMIHEGIPGHHLQLATAATHDSIIRRHVDAAEQAEGWTTMLEDYMLDLGYMGELTAEARFVGKRDLSRIGARVVIDLFLMTGERGFLDVGIDCDISSSDPFEAAGSLLAEVTGFNPGRVQGELNWYSQERGYPLCYLTGNKLVWAMKREAAKGPTKLAGLELDRRFHEVFLEAGNMPLTFLRRVMVEKGLL